MRIMNFPASTLLYWLVRFICGKYLPVVMRYLIHKWLYWFIVLPFVGLVFYGLWGRDWLFAGVLSLLLLAGHVAAVETYRQRKIEELLYRTSSENSQGH